MFWRSWFRRKHWEEKLDAELRFHIEQHVEDSIRSGLTPEEARRRAFLEFGGVDQIKEECRDIRPLAFLRTILQDLRFAFRLLRKSPGFTAVVVLTLGLGIGATTSVFSLVNAALLKPPPYPEPHRILVLSDRAWSQSGEIFSYIRERVRSFDRIAAYSGSSGWNFVFENRAEYVAGLPVSESFFNTLGVVPILGRGFNALEDKPNGPGAVVLSNALWSRMLGGRPEAVGELVFLGGQPHTVVGIMPPGFQTIPAADVWTPLRLSPTDNSFNYTVLGQLRSDRSYAQAAAELTSISSDMLRDLRDVSETHRRALRWIPYPRWLGLASRDELLLLLGAVTLLLLIACANVTCLQLMRAEGRKREMAMRSALGGGKVRLIQQVLTESVLLAMLGAALGIAMAHWGTQALLPLVPGWLLEGRTVELDWRVLAVTAIVAVGAGVLFGLTPALASSRLDLRTALVEGPRNTVRRPTISLRRVFALAQIPLVVLLLAGTGLLVRTFVNLRAVELGFDPSDVVIGKMSLQGTTTQTREQFSVFLEQTLARLREIPGVTAVAVGSNIPVEGGLNLPLEPPVGGLLNGARAIDWRYVTPEYFSLFGISLRTGRLFEQRDVSESTPVALVNEAFARAYFGGTSETLGRFVQLWGDLGDPPRQVVGVVGDVKAWSSSGWTGGINALGSGVPPTMYVPAAQVPESILQLVHHFVAMSWAVRTSRGMDVIPAVQQVVQSVEPRLPFIGFTTMEQVIARDLETQRFMMLLLSLFALLSLVLASVGVYGLFAYTVNQRTKEIGIRMALGASANNIVGQVVGHGLRIAVIGIAIGLGVSFVVTRLIASFLYGVSATDPATFVSASLLLMAVAALASYIPARRAARVHPMSALRTE